MLSLFAMSRSQIGVWGRTLTANQLSGSLWICRKRDVEVRFCCGGGGESSLEYSVDRLETGKGFRWFETVGEQHHFLWQTMHYISFVLLVSLVRQACRFLNYETFAKSVSEVKVGRWYIVHAVNTLWLVAFKSWSAVIIVSGLSKLYSVSGLQSGHIV